MDGEGESGLGDHVDAFVVQFEVPDDGVVEMLGAGAVAANVVAAPAASEFLAAGGEFADEVVEFLVVGSRPASVCRIATQMSAASSQPE